MTLVVYVHNPAEFVPYFLRGLLRCGPCGELLIPAYNGDRRRFYGCPNRKCPRPLVDAESVELAVWQRYATLNEQAATEVRRNQRHEALVEVLTRANVGQSLADIWYDWRD